jgi:hypothetical protein
VEAPSASTGPETNMAAITIEDLHQDVTLERRAMSAIRGADGGAPWIYGWIQPFVEKAAGSFGAVINFYQTNNFFVADQMNNQIQVTNVQNSATNATISVAPTQIAANFKQ